MAFRTMRKSITYINSFGHLYKYSNKPELRSVYRTQAKHHLDDEYSVYYKTLLTKIDNEGCFINDGTKVTTLEFDIEEIDMADLIHIVNRYNLSIKDLKQLVKKYDEENKCVNL